jgi:dihydroorotate dehydrogenase electron transfer subunit
MFRALGCEVRVATDDGSKGHKGFVTELLKSEVTSHQSPVTSKSQEPFDVAQDRPRAKSQMGSCVICACGPKVMLAAVSAIAEEAKISAFVSLEEFMGCGLGACLGCVIRTTSGHQRICHDGPVFDGAEVIWKR